jgi:hypothetical protein
MSEHDPNSSSSDAPDKIAIQGKIYKKIYIKETLRGSDVCKKYCDIDNNVSTCRAYHLGFTFACYGDIAYKNVTLNLMLEAMLEEKQKWQQGIENL